MSRERPIHLDPRFIERKRQELVIHTILSGPDVPPIMSYAWTRVGEQELLRETRAAILRGGALALAATSHSELVSDTREFTWRIAPLILRRANISPQEGEIIKTLYNEVETTTRELAEEAPPLRKLKITTAGLLSQLYLAHNAELEFDPERYSFVAAMSKEATRIGLRKQKQQAEEQSISVTEPLRPSAGNTLDDLLARMSDDLGES